MRCARFPFGWAVSDRVTGARPNSAKERARRHPIHAASGAVGAPGYEKGRPCGALVGAGHWTVAAGAATGADLEIGGPRPAVPRSVDVDGDGIGRGAIDGQ
jgi:hypothetical protein